MIIKHIGIIGYGNMAKNISINLIKKNFLLSIYNKDIVYTNIKNIILLTNNIKLFINSFFKEKIIFILIKSGKPTKIVLLKLKNYLNHYDIVIDFGNSYFKNTILNYYLIKKKYIFISSGISGGLSGALNGLCIMIDLSIKNYKKIYILIKCIAYFSKYLNFSISLGIGSSHYLKMIHNGIEYGVLQLISEIYFLSLILIKKKTLFNVIIYWNNSLLNSYLIKVLLNIILKKKNNICDKIDHQGTGKWCCLNSLKHNINLSNIIEALIVRIISKNIIFRNMFKKYNIYFLNGIFCIFYLKLKKVFFLCNIICYLQGINQILKIKSKYNWKFNFNNIIKSYLNSCIINSKVLFYFLNFKKLLKKKFLILIKNNYLYIKEIMIIIIKCDLNSSLINSCFNFLNFLINKNYNFKIIQFQRNYFGNHKIKKI